jgi:hypothetical protein
MRQPFLLFQGSKRQALPHNVVTLVLKPKKEGSMARKSFPKAKVAGKKRILNARKDTPDIRDRMYEPALIQLQPEIDNRSGIDVPGGCHQSAERQEKRSAIQGQSADAL